MRSLKMISARRWLTGWKLKWTLSSVGMKKQLSSLSENIANTGRLAGPCGVIQMSDELLDKLGTYFEHFDILSRYGITFEDFVGRVRRGVWCAWLA